MYWCWASILFRGTHKSISLWGLNWELHMGHGSDVTESPLVQTLNLGAESVLSRCNLIVHVDIEQRQKTKFLYNTFQNYDLMRPWKANWWPWDKAGTFVYTRFGLTFRSVSVLVPIFRKYPLSRWWICLVSDPSPKLHSVPVWMDEARIFPPVHQDPARLQLHFVLLHVALCAVAGQYPWQSVLCSWFLGILGVFFKRRQMKCEGKVLKLRY